MKFHINYTPAKPGFEINHDHTLFLVGSCFTENIGRFLSRSKFKTHINPNGILFNPSSIYINLNSIIHLKNPDPKLILQREGLFYSYSHHSSYSASTQNELIQNINSERETALTFLKKADFLVITFGTAFIYHHTSLDQTVSNCHKQEASLFNKNMLKVDQITKMYSELINDLKRINPALKLMFTVSPVKHLKDGVEENNLSKATLLLSIHTIVNENPDCFYFPAYELVNDDLRDYRFYKEDLAHPNDLAINYVWDKFSDCYFNPQTQKLNQLIHKLNLALDHRPIQENSKESEKLKDFITRQKVEINKLNPQIEF